MTDDDENQTSSDVGEPEVMSTAFETFDENYKPHPRPNLRKMK